MMALLGLCTKPNFSNTPTYMHCEMDKCVKKNENLVEIKDFYFVKVLKFHESIFVLCQGLGIWVDYPRSSFNPCR